ncbi:MAG: hypothetical protein H8E60_08850 [Candidatus Marinimicrobia bacterium]|nr:hypothetical protein [Candidatus Neomarinimicrobiota bacterium]
MSENFIKLTKDNLPSGKLNSGKIIKSDRVKIGNEPKIISNENNPKSKAESKQGVESSSSKEFNNENSFTFKPIYNEDVLIELGVNCVCGNHSKVIFKTEEKEITIENQDIPELESEETEENLEQSEN